MANTVEIEGLADISAEFSKMVQQIDNRTDKSLKTVSQDLLGRAQERAPIEQGDLRQSGQAIQIDKGWYNVNFTAIDPKSGEDYAVRQHEDLELDHSRTDGHRNPETGRSYNMIAGGEAKYLERPFRENANKYIAYIQTEALKAITDTNTKKGE